MRRLHLLLAADLKRLHACLADLFTGGGGAGAQIGAFADQRGIGALHRTHPVDAGEAALGQLAKAVGFVVDQLRLAVIGLDLVADARDPRGQLRLLLLDDTVASPRLTVPVGQLMFLQRQRVAREHRVLAGQADEIGRRRDGGRAALLRRQPGTFGLKPQRLRRKGPLAGPDIAARQFDQDVARMDMLPFADMQAADDAAVAVLDGLDVARHADGAGDRRGGIHMDKGGR